MTKYEIGPRWLKADIEVVEVTKETTGSVWLKTSHWGPRREAKKSDHAEYYDTWQEAHARLCELAAQRLIQARNALQSAQDIDGNIRGMKQPLQVERNVQEKVTVATKT